MLKNKVYKISSKNFHFILKYSFNCFTSFKNFNLSNFQFNINLLDVYDFRDEFGDIYGFRIPLPKFLVTKISLIIPFLYALYSKKV